MKKAPTAEIKRHWGRVAELGCLISYQPAPTMHHCHAGSMTEIIGLKGGALKSSDWLVIPLHAHYHTGDQGVDRIGVLTWERLYGRQVDHLDRVCLLLGYNVWYRAGVARDVPGLAVVQDVRTARTKRVPRDLAG